jgi:hypothetical protein
MKKSIIISGQKGSGKTRIAMTIADEIGYDYAEIRHIKDLEKYINKPTVIDYEGYGLSPEVFNSLPDKDKFDIVFVAYDTMSVKEIIKNFEGHTESRGYSAEISIEVAKSISAISKIIKTECDKFGYKFIDINPKEVGFPHSIIADKIWEYLFNEKKQLDLSIVGNKFGEK